MPRRLLIALLALGTVGGYASGFATLARHRAHLRHHCHHGAWEYGWSPNGPHGPREPSSPPGATPPSSSGTAIHIAAP